MNLLVSWVWHVVIKTFGELGQDANDPDKHGLALRDAIGIDELLCDQGVEAGSAFDRGAARVVKKPRPLPALPLAVAFGRVKQGRKAGAIQLIAHLAVKASRGILDVYLSGARPSTSRSTVSLRTITESFSSSPGAMRPARFRNNSSAQSAPEQRRRKP